MTAIHIKGVQVGDGKQTLLQALDLTLTPGSALTLVGESGSGKSLLAHALMGTLPAPLLGQGQLEVAGHHYDLAEPHRLRVLWGRELAMLPQEPVMALDPTMGLLHQVEEGWLAGGQQARSQARASLEHLGLAGRERHFAHQLSGGMAQRAAFAAATLGQARLLIADEPTKGLDSLARARLQGLLLGYLAQARQLLTITHDLTLARALGGWVLVIKGGEIVEQGPAERVLHHPAHAYTRALLAADPAAWPKKSAPATGDWLLRGEGLTMGYGEQTLFQGLDVQLAQGERLAIMAPSGAGKSTLGNVLLGLQRPLQGHVVRREGVAHHRWQKLYQDPVQAFASRVRLGTLFDDLLRRHRLPRQRLTDYLARLGLDESLLRRLPGQVSGGELQRLSLIRALLLHPVMLFADEPTSRLDPLSQQQTMTCLLEELGEIGCALLLVTHDEALADKVGERCLRLGMTAGTQDEGLDVARVRRTV
ncbi:ABC transporter ATP-binding protein [Aeromonas salmonicida]|uniref:ABC transporter ATP-binding protein n=1 Tax=Aeromonas salmonicida TaxID=645 RepID=UPI002115E17F|nr:ATP-binding cassette domain-containing protein [Aeromonas salmonicida]UUI62676.1 ATP-binding cassette domain-containing protein [Aeromonas salmonicida]